jgi:RNA polymerase sigma-70 factor (ECF subfamily)
MQNYDHLFRYGLRMIADRSVSMDCINELFTEVWDRRHRLPEVEQVRGYLFVIFKRKLSRHVTRRQPVLSLAEEDMLSFPHNDSSYEELLIAMQSEEEKKMKVRMALDHLTGRQKELIRLRYYDNLSMEEISEKLQISLRTIYNTMHSAITILRKELHP